MKKFIIVFAVLISSLVSLEQSYAIKNLKETIKDSATEEVDNTIDKIGDAVGDKMGDLADEALKTVFGEDSGAFPTGSFTAPEVDKYDGISETSARSFILKVLNFVLSFLGIICVAAIIYAGFLYVTGATDEGNYEKAKKIIIYVVIGILVILVSYALVNVVINLEDSASGGSSSSSRDGSGTTSTKNTQGGNTGNNSLRTGDSTLNTGSPTTSTSTNSKILPSGLISVSGSGVTDFGAGVYAPLESATEGLTFSVSTDGQIIFDFGDGTRDSIDTTTNSGASVTHAFGEEKTFNVRAVVLTADGETYGIQKLIIVGGAEAKFTASDTSTTVNESIELKASNSKVPKGSITAYNWSCEGAGGCFSNKSGEKVYVEFTEPGTYTVTLDIESSIGATAKTSQEISITSDEPVAEFTYSSTADSSAPGEFSFDASDSYGIEGGTSGLTFKWDFDGVSKETSSTSIIYEFDTTGSKEVSLQVEETHGSKNYESEEVSETVSVDSVLSVNFDNPSPVKKGESVSFQGESNNADEFEWTFPGSDETIHGKNASYQFSDSGNHEVTLKAVDGDESNEVTKTVTVLNLDDPTALISVSVDGKKSLSSSLTMERGSSISISSESKNQDGESSNLEEIWTVNGTEVSNAEISSFFKETGTYTIKLTVIENDDSSLRDSTSVSITITNKEPEINSISFSSDGNLGASQVTVSVDAEDSDGDIVSYKFEVLELGRSIEAQITREPEAIFNLEQYSGEHEYFFRVTVTDDDG
ncbi:MAG: PKD domain-containing protein, partial [Candidatus Peregrinibacteria bacterium]|nr:PKD domain-containing protein [Candidatus Peregrinibacteria bacterium]